MKAWEATVRKTQAAAKKRANTIFGTSHQAEPIPELDQQEEEPPHAPGEIYHAERFLPNGDYYTGHWVDSFPHGTGKYWWTDGCMYVGEWFRGKTMGQGTFSWPSSATYQGNFKSGFMDGEGTYTGANGGTYKGSWVMNLKHGYGIKEYANGDCYDGEWSRGWQEGKGKYQWNNGNYYIGEWKNGTISGSGTMFMANGSKYEGDWEDGLPKGNPELETKEFLNELKECKISPVEKVPIWPSQKKLSVVRPRGSLRQRRLSMDERIDVAVEKDLGSLRLSDGAMPSLWKSSGSIREYSEIGFSKGSKIMIPKLMKRPGETISKGHKNYDLMLNLQLGIRHSVGRPGPPPSLDLRPSAFDPKEKYWTRFPTEGSKNTPPHQSAEFRWKDYCPKVFRSLRKLFNVDPADYMLSICGSYALRELSTPGKSGSFFYFTNDDRYMIKTMKKSETKVILRMLNAYYNHVVAFENTLVTKYYGLHCVKFNGQKVRFVIMGNLFCSGYTIHRRYDLKGSTFGRLTDKPESEIDSNTTLKDLDLNFIFRLQRTWFHEFRRQVDKDCELLQQERIMDYSLLVGLHFTDITHNDSTLSGSVTPSDKGGSDEKGLSSNTARWPNIKLGINMPARVERTERKHDVEIQLVGEPTGQYYDVVLFFGIIDILQDYDITKKLEHAYKSIQYDPNSISAVDPKLYSRRFRDYILRAFAEDV